MDSTIREPYVAGKFYPQSKSGITELINRIRTDSIYEVEEIFVNNIVGAIVPHAGHIYSGYQTIVFFEYLIKVQYDFDTIVILHPLHNGGYHPFATDHCSFWKTPLGKIEVDTDFIKETGIYQSDHLLKFEHSAEVIIPFIQYFGYGQKKIVPVGIASQTPENAVKISAMIKKAVENTGRKILLIASSDFSHFISPQEGKLQDDKVLEAINKMDIEKIYQTIIMNNISVCGYGPIMTLIDYSLSCFSNVKTRILARGHSGQVHPSDNVVDYVSMMFFT